MVTFEQQLIGKWSNETIHVSFDGTPKGKHLGLMGIGACFSNTASPAYYTLYEKDNERCIQVVTDFHSGNPNHWSFKVLQLDEHILQVQNPYDGPVITLVR